MHTLLPRSTGLHYSLRSLAPKIPSLQMIDITVAYPGNLLLAFHNGWMWLRCVLGIPPFGYGQSFYTLRSIYCDRVPPPAVHMHIRKFNVAREVPIGDLSSSHSQTLSNGTYQSRSVEIEVPEAERTKFDLWLRDLWREKDIRMTKFLETGSLAVEGQERIEIPLRLKHKREVLDAFCFFIPALIGWSWTKLRSAWSVWMEEMGNVHMDSSTALHFWDGCISLHTCCCIYHMYVLSVWYSRLKFGWKICESVLA